MRKKLTVLGNAGQLGQELVSEFTSRGYIVSGLDRAEVDIADRFQVEECIGALDPSIVVNAAAYNQVDVAEREPQAAFAVNALAVRNIAIACRQVDASLVHFSTDYVFDGTAGRPYTEDGPDAAPGGLRGFQAGRRDLCVRLSREAADHSDIRGLRPRGVAHGARQLRRVDAAAGGLAAAHPRGRGSLCLAGLRSRIWRPARRISSTGS